MKEFVVTLLRLNIVGSILLFVILLLRPLTRKAPQWVNGILWTVLCLRLIIPFSLSAPQIIAYSMPGTPIQLDAAAENAIVNIVEKGSELVTAGTDNTGTSAAASVSVYSVIFAVWAAGVVLMLVYSAVSSIKLHRTVRGSVHIRGNVYICDKAKTPFVLGLIRPRIYLTPGMSTEDLDCVISHESSHIKHGDHLGKTLGFLLLCVYWYNPLMWLAYALFCRDVEYACDMRTVSRMDRGEVADYSEALVRFASDDRKGYSCPLAFAEVGVKSRVSNLLNYKKPAIGIVVGIICICFSTSVFFFTGSGEVERFVQQAIGSETYPQQINVDALDVQVADAPSQRVELIDNNVSSTGYGYSYGLMVTGFVREEGPVLTLHGASDTVLTPYVYSSAAQDTVTALVFETATALPGSPELTLEFSETPDSVTVSTYPITSGTGLLERVELINETMSLENGTHLYQVWASFGEKMCYYYFSVSVENQ